MKCVIEYFKGTAQTVYGPFANYMEALDFISTQQKDEEKGRLYTYEIFNLWGV